MKKFLRTYATTLLLAGGALLIGGLIIGGIYGWGSYQGRNTDAADERNGKQAGQAVSYAGRAAVDVASEQGKRFYASTFSLKDLAQEVTKRDKRVGIVLVLQKGDDIEAGNVYFDEKNSTPSKLKILYKVEGRGEFIFGITADARAKKIQAAESAPPPEQSTPGEPTVPAERE